MKRTRQATILYNNIARDEVLRDNRSQSFVLKRVPSWFFTSTFLEEASSRVSRARVARRQKTSQRVGVCFCSRISRVPWWADYCHDHGNDMKIHERERKIKHDTEAPRAPWPVDRVPELNYSLKGQMRTRSRGKKRLWVSGVVYMFVEACVSYTPVSYFGLHCVALWTTKCIVSAVSFDSRKSSPAKMKHARRQS